MSYNLQSFEAIKSRVDLEDLAGWLERELSEVPEKERNVVESVARDLPYFARWPKQPLIFFPGAIRPNNRTYHEYPQDLRLAYRRRTGRQLDTRPNGPAIAAFLFAGGARPLRAGSTNEWSIHHVYNGKFPYVGKGETLHAVKSADHFTNSAGLVAAHPILDTMVDEYPALAWRLRAEAFLRFNYDPDGVFAIQIS